MMHVTVENHHTLRQTLGLHRASSDDDVVEQAEPLTTVTRGVVHAPTQVDGYPIMEGGTTGGDGTADGAPGTVDQFRRPGQADTGDLPAGELPAHNLTESVPRLFLSPA
jgi:hypothetical protein